MFILNLDHIDADMVVTLATMIQATEIAMRERNMVAYSKVRFLNVYIVSDKNTHLHK